MAEKRKGKQKRHQDEPETPTKEEKAVARYLRFNVESKEGKFHGMTVQYFIASKAVDKLLDSKWSSEKAKSNALFTNRVSCVDFCNRLLEKGMFHRAARVERKKDRDKRKKKTKDGDTEEVAKDEDKKGKKDKKKKKKDKDGDKEDQEEKKEGEDAEKEEAEKEEKKEEEKKKKKEKKLKLEMHDQQIFKDGDEVYVWIYDPIPLQTFIIGLLLVLGAIGVCMFPLWPPEVKNGVYYLSLAVAGFVGVILALAVIRLILFCFIWGLTFGKHHFWFLPNLTEDVGFFESFVPLYKHDVKSEKKKKDKTEKDTDETAEKTEKKNGDDKEMEAVASTNVSEKEGGGEGVEEVGSKSESENENGYEVIEAEDIQEEGVDSNSEDEHIEVEEEDLEPKKTK